MNNDTIEPELKEAFEKILAQPAIGNDKDEMLINLMHAAYTLGSEGEWISVEDMLPDHDQEVNVWLSGGSIKSSTFRINNGFKSFYCGSSYTMSFGKEFIKGWQPLPSPPQSK